ncbi:transglycosylase domain-containing protein [Sphingomonas sanguinis]|jgi:penicillin-binding protein 1A|uniref:Penicillin-binding protein n=1 Tax=Sphingomonas sanguinis TaxID=33051 RepID=A0A7Y7QZB5_9SPHN|nr:transglycosylase domain-containing protein [Sphingomonas sanguinis]MBZ6383940.1 penicillin-binding protein [Sphingomonas sanguinis]NNG50672.1 penicillin-binding protein [Sphingomonas sanguinis]NNG55430.1 penicillin-binding protein [Sphingomonas sanguinis]NVP33231.1 penicillin-binding protein [Sphingomonas sanguinis]
MRPDPFNPDRVPLDRPYEPVGPHYPLYDAETQSWSFGTDEAPEDVRPRRRIRWGRWIMRGMGAGIILLVIAIIWLAVTAPLSRSLQPPTPPSITLTADDGTPIARRGAIIGAPVDAAKLPAHVREAFMAIEDRRFYSHWGVDPRGILRAAWHNVGSGGVREGGSTITQQLAKNAFLDSDRTAGRKIREAMIAFWLEAWLTKDEILSRYLSNVYFGDNVYGITAASKHYFGRTPDKLNIGQAAMLAGLVKAPSRLAPTTNLKGARARQAVVVAAMEDAGFLTKAEADAVQPQRVLASRPETLPSGTYFADWVLPEARDQAGEIKTEATVQTTLNPRLQRIAERTVRSAGLNQAQVALVAMRPDGRVVAMVGGKDYSKSPFNRATQARRQPGSAFKLFVYLAALRSGMTPDSTIEDEPVDIAGWKPRNSDGRYLGKITLRQAFARSSNVAAARLTQAVGVKSVIKAARDLGITTPIPNEATIGLGTSTVSLLELTAAYAAVANESYPVAARGLNDVKDKGWYQSLTDRKTGFASAVHDGMLDLLSSSIKTGTGRQALLTVDAYGKTGTTQDSRDALFVGFARDLVVGVWVGNDDNTPNPGLSGGGVPARIWRAFMQSALDIPPVPAPVVMEETDPDAISNGMGEEVMPAETDPVGDIIQGLGIDLKTGEDGSISIGPGRRRGERPPPGPEDRRPPDERYDGEE